MTVAEERADMLVGETWEARGMRGTIDAVLYVAGCTRLGRAQGALDRQPH
jgi:hypothetical protein